MCLNACVCFQKLFLQKEHALRFTRRIGSIEHIERDLESKAEKEKNLPSGFWLTDTLQNVLGWGPSGQRYSYTTKQNVS